MKVKTHTKAGGMTGQHTPRVRTGVKTVRAPTNDVRPAR